MEILSLFEITSIVGTFLIVYFTWKQAKIASMMRSETAPVILEVESKGENIFKVFIVNNKPHNIALQNVFVKKKIFWFFYSKPLDIKWFPQTKSGDTGGPKSFLIAKPLSQNYGNGKEPQYVIKDQCEFHITIFLYQKTSIYRIFVRTTGGLCQSICPSSQKLQNEVS